MGYLDGGGSALPRDLVLVHDRVVGPDCEQALKLTSGAPHDDGEGVVSSKNCGVRAGDLDAVVFSCRLHLQGEDGGVGGSRQGECLFQALASVTVAVGDQKERPTLLGVLKDFVAKGR